MFDLRRLLFDKHREWKKFPDWVKEEYCRRTGREIPMEIPDWYNEFEFFLCTFFALFAPMFITWAYNSWILHSGFATRIPSIIISLVVGGVLASVVSKFTINYHDNDPDKLFRGHVGNIRHWLNFLPRGYESLWDRNGKAIPKEKLKAEVEGYLGMLGAAVVGYESIKGYEKNPELKLRHDEIRAILMNCCERAANCILPPETKGTSFLKL